MINSEAAVHLFGIDTVYKPAKNILDFALSQPSLRNAIADVLRRRGHNVNAALTDGKVVFSPHIRTGSPLLGHVKVKGLEGVRAELGEQLGRVHNSGVLHRDAELRNLVVSDGPGPGPAVMIVDFERAITKGGFRRRIDRLTKSASTYTDAEMEHSFLTYVRKRRSTALHNGIAGRNAVVTR